MLGTDRLPASAAILQVCHDTRFADALVLTTASPRRLTFLVARHHLGGLQSVLASSLGMVCYETGPARWHEALRTCTRVLASGGMLVEFQDAEAHQDKEGAETASSTLARQAWAGAFPDTPPVVLPVHRFRPADPNLETLVQIGEPPAPGRAVQNAFALDAPICNRLLRDFERALREQLQEEWAAKPGRKQAVDGFRLSPGAAARLHDVNCAESESLLELGQLLRAEREARRQCSLAQLRAQQGRKELSPLWRALTSIETVVGFPLALYAAVNHAIAGLLIAAFIVARRGKEANIGAWVIRAVIVVACYAGQTLLVDRLLGRAAAGYYAVTLPVSGAYLWRYWWLLRRRTRILLLGAQAATLQAQAQQNRKRFLEKLRAILDSGVQATRAAEASSRARV